MYKKLLISFALLISILFSFSVCFANDNNMGQDTIDGVRSVVGGAENAIEGAVNGVGNATRDMTRDLGNDGNNTGNTMMNNGDNNNTAKDTNNNTGNNNNTNTNNNNNTATTNNNSLTARMTDNYTATRTATDTAGNATFMGMNATTWTWLIIGIAAIAIVALVWYYSMQMRSTNYDNRD